MLVDRRAAARSDILQVLIVLDGELLALDTDNGALVVDDRALDECSPSWLRGAAVVEGHSLTALAALAAQERCVRLGGQHGTVIHDADELPGIDTHACRCTRHDCRPTSALGRKVQHRALPRQEFNVSALLPSSGGRRCARRRRIVLREGRNEKDPCHDEHEDRYADADAYEDFVLHKVISAKFVLKNVLPHPKRNPAGKGQQWRTFLSFTRLVRLVHSQNKERRVGRGPPVHSGRLLG